MKIDKKIIIAKIGSSALFTRRNRLDEFRISHIADQLFTLQKKGYDIVLVVSGAVACGFMADANDRMHLSSMRYFSLLRQAAAGIGQVQLIKTFYTIFRQKQMRIAQILLNKYDLQIEENREKMKMIIEYYVKSGVIAILNENDVVDLNSFGGNDFLAAEICKLLNADSLYILSTREGSIYSVGGGKTKEAVAKIMTAANINCHIIDGKSKGILCYHVLKHGNKKHL